MRMTLANRGSKPVEVRIWTERLPGAELALAQPIRLEAGQTIEQRFDIRVRPFPGYSDVNRFRVLAQPSDQATPDTFDLTFIMPVPAKEK
jgi:hypothetical protein